MAGKYVPVDLSIGEPGEVIVRMQSYLELPAKEEADSEVSINFNVSEDEHRESTPVITLTPLPLGAVSDLLRAPARRRSIPISPIITTSRATTESESSAISQASTESAISAIRPNSLAMQDSSASNMSTDI